MLNCTPFPSLPFPSLLTCLMLSLIQSYETQGTASANPRRYLTVRQKVSDTTKNLPSMICQGLRGEERGGKRGGKWRRGREEQEKLERIKEEEVTNSHQIHVATTFQKLDVSTKTSSAATFLTRSFVMVSRTFPLRFLICEETKSLSTGLGGGEAWGRGVGE